MICNIKKKIKIFFLGFKKTHLIEKKKLPAQQPTRRLLQTEQEVGCKVLRNMKGQNVAVHPKEDTCSEDVLDVPQAFC